MRPIIHALTRHRHHRPFVVAFIVVFIGGCAASREAARSVGFHDGQGTRSKSDSGVATTQRNVDDSGTPRASAEVSSSVALVSGERGSGGMMAAARLPQPRPRPDGESEKLAVPLPAIEKPADERYPINLGTALQLAGANNLQIALATERVREALARLEGAEVLWVPSLNAGVGYNAHRGQIQATEGPVIEVNRESAFVGGGPVLSGAPLTGAAGGPARFFVDISPADIYFEPLAARQAAAGAQADESAVLNDTLLQVTITYLALLEAQSQVAIAEEAVRFAEELLRVTEQFAESGAGLPADAERARAERADRRRDVLQAEERVRVISAELARQLRLPPATVLYVVDAQPVPLPLISEDRPLDELIARGLSNRPELSRQQAVVGETRQRWRQEQVRPWVPNLHVGLSSGGFAGGGDGFFGDFSDRTDFDALAVWELQNLGLGNRALQRQRASRHRQAHLAFQQMSDRVAAEIMQAYQQVQFRRRQIEQAKRQVEAAAKALPLNFLGIRGRELRAIEAQQAIRALAAARNRYLEAVIGYNRAQFALLRAVGIPPQAYDEDDAAGPAAAPPLPQQPQG